MAVRKLRKVWAQENITEKEGMENMRRAMARRHPLGPTVNKPSSPLSVQKYFDSLSKQDKAQLTRAIYFYHRVVNPGYRPTRERRRIYNQLGLKVAELNQQNKGG